MSSRRTFIKNSVLGASYFPFINLNSLFSTPHKAKMKFGLVTYLWAKDWDLPTLISNCEKSEVYGVELRVQHAHGVDRDLSKTQRKEVKQRFKDSKVTAVGLGTNQEFHSPDQSELRKNIEGAKEFIILSHDIGGSGVKVKPNAFPEGVSKEKTIEQIGRSLNELGQFGQDYGQEIRLEVHGRETQQLPVIDKIMEVAQNKNVGVCWNSNNQDLDGKGLKHNFNLVKDRLAETIHVREFNEGNYPYQQLINLLYEADYKGWILMEARTDPADKVKALIEQRQILEDMIKKASS